MWVDEPSTAPKKRSNMDIKLGTIPGDDFYDYRVDVMFDCYKWDLQSNEQGTISDKVILLSEEDNEFLKSSAINLFNETVKIEEAVKLNPELAIEMGISENMAIELSNCDYCPEKHIRYMRFDFHPTKTGWMISEVNGDTPAGFPEASLLPKKVEKYFNDYRQDTCFGEILLEKFVKKVDKGKTIAFLHDTHCVEDLQILHYLGDLFKENEYKVVYLGPENIQWENDLPKDIDVIMRYYPTEWLEYVENFDWKQFINSNVIFGNHPVALFSQSKRLPVIWDKLNIDIPFWKKLLPETKCPTEINIEDDWIFKPAFGRVGEGISISDSISKEEEEDIINAVQEFPKQWVAQKMFESVPVEDLHICVGAYVADGKFAGYLGRTSKKTRIDGEASEVPVLTKIKEK